jgi:WD40 repeat protein
LLPNLLSPRAAQFGQTGHVLAGHQGLIAAVAYSPNSTRIVSGSWDCTIRVWSAITFEELGLMQGHTKAVTSVIFSPDGSRIFSGSWDRTVRIWSALTLEHIATIEGHQGSISSLAMSPDGKCFVSVAYDESLRVWCTSSFAELGQLELPRSEVFSVAFSPKGDRIATLCFRTVVVYDSQTLEILAELEATKNGWPNSTGRSTVAFSRDGLHLFASTFDRPNVIRVWDAITYQEHGSMIQSHGSGVLSVSSNDALVISGTNSGHIQVWENYIEIARFRSHQRAVLCLAFSPDGTHFVSGGHETLRVWETRGNNDESSPSGIPSPFFDQVIWSPGGERVLCRMRQDVPRVGRSSKFRIWDVKRWKELGDIEDTSLIAFSPDGKCVVALSSESGLPCVWTFSPFEQLSVFTDESNGPRHITSITYSTDGARLICGTKQGSIQCWSTENFGKLSDFKAHSGSVNHGMFSSNGTRFVSGSNSDIQLWTANTLEKLGEIEGLSDLLCMAISHSGTSIVTGQRNGIVRVWSAVNCCELVRFKRIGQWVLTPQHVAFSPDGRSFFALLKDGPAHAQWPASTWAWTSKAEDDCA